MATPSQLDTAAPSAAILAEGQQVLAFLTALGGDQEKANRYNADAVVVRESGPEAIWAAEMLRQAEANKPKPITPDQALTIVRMCINHGGEWGGRAIWAERMQRPSYAELKYMPAESPKWHPEKVVTWDQWLKSAKGFVDRTIGDPDPARLILGVPPWPHRNGSWWSASQGAFDVYWTQFWNEVKRMPGWKRRRWIIRFWEFNGSWYIFRITVGGLYESATIDPGKAQHMAVAIRRFFDIGHKICGADIPLFDFNMAGGVSEPAIEYGWPGDDYVDRLTIDRYVSLQDARDPSIWTRDIDQLAAAADAHGCAPGISEGSIYQDKVKDGKQLGGQDSAGAIECGKILHGRMLARAKSGKPMGDVMWFSRDPRPEGYFDMWTLGAPGTFEKPGDEIIRFPNGKSYKVHDPEICEALLPLWAGPIAA
jgi:hypothetical protein